MNLFSYFVCQLIIIILFLPSAGLSQYIQQGSKLTPIDAIGSTIYHGYSVALSEDGNTAIVGGIGDNANEGAVWVYKRSGDVWTLEAKLIGTGVVGSASVGFSVALSADGNTAIVGGLGDNNFAGAAWVFVRSGTSWSQGAKLVGTGAVGGAQQGGAVALSADGNTALVGGFRDNNFAGAVWVWTRCGFVWCQQTKLVATNPIGSSRFGISVDLSADGNTAIIGGHTDNANAGAVWIFSRSGSSWTYQSKLTGAGAIGTARFGRSVSISADGNTAMVGGYEDDAQKGAVWVFTRSGGSWTQQGNKLVGTGATGNAWQGFSVSLSADGNTALVGGPDDNALAGATWVFKRSGGVWSQLGSKLVGSDAVGNANQGVTVAISSDGNTAIIGGIADNTNRGAAWVFVPGTLTTGWIVQNSGVTANLKATHFASSTAGGAVGANGTIVTTSNGGVLWNVQNSGTTEQLWDIHFISESSAWAVGNSGTILYTSNGGSTWSPQVSNTTNSLFDVCFVSQNIGWVVGSDGLILNTIDGGNTWTPQTSGTIEALRAAFFISETKGWAVGFSNTVLKTTDGGTTWSPQTANFGNYYDVHFISATQGWIVGSGNGSLVVTTTDGGTTWTILPTGFFYPILLAVHFVSPTKGWVNNGTPTTSASSIRTTSDGGITWTLQQTPVTVATEDAYFIDAGLGWAVGNNGIILKFIDPTVGVDDDDIVQLKYFMLEQNYPNPFNPSTNIKFTIESGQFVSLKVYDILGNEVATLVNEEKPAGLYNIEFNAAELTSGVYFYQITAGNFVETKKMILLK